MAKTLRYTLDDFRNITFDGFILNLPEDTLLKISEIALQVGSPSYIRTPIFEKKERVARPVEQNEGDLNPIYKKRRNRNNMDQQVNDSDWETIRTFQATKFEQKEGVESQINDIKLILNKITDKNYNEYKVKMIEIVSNSGNNYDELLKIGTIIFEIASTNLFYSKIYADLYTELMGISEIMMDIFEKSFESFIDLFNNIEYVEPNVDYDKFCKINKDNDKRRALSSFIVNLMNNGIVKKEQIINILSILLNQINTYISQENKKNEVDEISENVSILYKKELMESYEIETVNNLTISNFIEVIANSKVKSYKSLTNKTIFKFMDMIEM
jgi:hypothetical protein